MYSGDDDERTENTIRIVQLWLSDLWSHVLVVQSEEAAEELEILYR